ncbi:MAG: ADP-ribosylglycohydrolase family protein, partial [Fimbriimonadales bacterium]
AQTAADLGALATRHFRSVLTPHAVAPVIGRAEDELRTLLEAVVESVVAGHTPEAFIRAQGWTRGVSGYIYHTIPAALHAWLRFPNRFEEAVQSLIRCGGDTDSMAALLGIWMGAQWGAECIPEPWQRQLKDPISRPAQLRVVAQCVVEALRQQAPLPAPRPLFPVRLLRNLMFLALVLAHVGRRLLPPY